MVANGKVNCVMSPYTRSVSRLTTEDNYIYLFFVTFSGDVGQVERSALWCPTGGERKNPRLVRQPHDGKFVSLSSSSLVTHQFYNPTLMTVKI